MTKSSGYTQFNYHMRDWLSILIKKGYTLREIGRRIGMHHTSVSREITRNRIRKNIYDPIIANELSKTRRSQSRILKIEKYRFLYNFIERMLTMHWSPDVIAGYLKRKQFSQSISHETIYKYIYRYQREWIHYLARGHRKRFKRSGKYGNRRKIRIPERVSIDKRPQSVENRRIFGHFEADCMVTRVTKGSILALIERKTRYVKLIKLNRKTALNVKDGIIQALERYKSVVKSITYDNGTENVMHRIVNEKLNCKSYFCNPYHSWEKGSVENVIGLIRQFIPKGSELSNLSKKELRKIEFLINWRPRKILNYCSPKELFDAEWCTYG